LSGGGKEEIARIVARWKLIEVCQATEKRNSRESSLAASLLKFVWQQK